MAGKKRKKIKKVQIFHVIQSNGAGIDIGATEIHVAVTADVIPTQSGNLRHSRKIFMFSVEIVGQPTTQPHSCFK